MKKSLKKFNLYFFIALIWQKYPFLLIFLVPQASQYTAVEDLLGGEISYSQMTIGKHWSNHLIQLKVLCYTV